MHAYILARGTNAMIDRWENDLNAIHLPYTIPYDICGTDGKVKHKAGMASVLQLGVRPIRLYEIAFPKEHLDTILRTIKPMNFTGDNSMSRIRSVMNTIVWLLRKVLKLKNAEIPKKGEQYFLTKQYVDCRLIGLKDDPVSPKGLEMV